MSSVYKNINIESLTPEGEGLAFSSDRKIFVPGAFPGEIVDAVSVLEKDKYAVCSLEKVIKPVAGRIPAFCSTPCGACSFCTLSYEEELKIKEDRLLALFKEIPEFTVDCWQGMIGMKTPFNFRNKAVYACSTASGEFISGFYSRGTHAVCTVKSCDVQVSWINTAYEKILSALKGLSVEDPFVKSLRYMFFRGQDEAEKMVVLVSAEDLPVPNTVVDAANQAGIDTLILNINSSTGNRILGDCFRNITGTGSITMDMCGKKFFLRPESFFQVNTVQAEILYDKAIQLLAPNSENNVLDLYSGAGTITLALADKVNHVYGIECVNDAVHDAEENAKRLGVDNVEFHAGLVEKELPELISRGIKLDSAILDPARKGCASSVLEALSSSEIKKIVYISCCPETQCRDIKILLKHGWKIDNLQSVDMFPHTMHVETVVLMSRVERK